MEIFMFMGFVTRLASSTSATESITEVITETVESSVVTVGAVTENTAWVGHDLYNVLMRAVNAVSRSTAAMWAFVAMIVLCMVVGYLLGSINPSIIISKKKYKEDIRAFGSGNAGTTNTLRTYGAKTAVAVFLLDLLKAAVAVVIGAFVIGGTMVGGAIAGLFAVVGHMFPVYYKFKGGKGVACGAMVMLLISPFAFIVDIIVFVGIVFFTRYISLGSIVCAMFFPILTVAFSYSGFVPLCALIIAALIVFMHRANIKRIMDRTESKVSFKKTDKHKAGESSEAQKAEEEKKAIKKALPETEEREYTDADFVKCACGRLIPVSRRVCAYCDKENPSYKPKAEAEKGGKKKKK